jgi:hypothetical protein
MVTHRLLHCISLFPRRLIQQRAEYFKRYGSIGVVYGRMIPSTDVASLGTRYYHTDLALLPLDGSWGLWVYYNRKKETARPYIEKAPSPHGAFSWGGMLYGASLVTTRDDAIVCVAFATYTLYYFASTKQGDIPKSVAAVPRHDDTDSLHDGLYLIGWYELAGNED